MRIQQAIAAALACAAVGLAGHRASAQPTLPPLPGAPPAAPAQDVGAETSRLTKLYGLSNDQPARVRTILGEQAKKADDVVRQQLPLDQALGRLKSVKDEEASRVADVMTLEQRSRYENDSRPALPSLPAAPAQR